MMQKENVFGGQQEEEIWKLMLNGNLSEEQQKEKSTPPNPKGKGVVEPSEVTKETDADKEEQMEHFEEVDYTEYFTTNETFRSKEEVKDWAKSRARMHNMFIIIYTSHPGRFFLQCERGGKHRTRKSAIDVESKKFTGSKKCLCPFNLKGWERKGVWRLSVLNGKHNHAVVGQDHNHSLVSRLSQKQYELVILFTKSGMKPKEILDHLRQEDPNTRTTLKHIYNARNKMKVEEIKGHPEKNCSNGDPPAPEYAVTKFAISQSSSGSQKGDDRSSSGSIGRDLSGRGCGSSKRGHGKSSSSAAQAKYSTECPPFSSELPSFLVPYITSWLNVARDGNCGYRVVADVIYGSEDRWMDVRRDLYREIIHRFALYQRIFGSENGMRTLLLSLCYWEKAMAPKDKWMTLSDMGLVIATTYNVAVLELSATQNVTYLPLCDDNGTGQISRFISFGYLPADEHYVLLNLADQCPVPPFYQQWSRFRDNSVAFLDGAFTNRRIFWDFLQAQG